MIFGCKKEHPHIVTAVLLAVVILLISIVAPFLELAIAIELNLAFPDYYSAAVQVVRPWIRLIVLVLFICSLKNAFCSMRTIGSIKNIKSIIVSLITFIIPFILFIGYALTYWGPLPFIE